MDCWLIPCIKKEDFFSQMQTILCFLLAFCFPQSLKLELFFVRKHGWNLTAERTLFYIVCVFTVANGPDHGNT